MKELFIAFSRYNQKTNAIIFDFIKDMTLDQLTHCTDTYYKTILDSVFHIMHSDLRWLSRMTEFYTSDCSVDMLEAFSEDSRPDNDRIFETIDSFCKLRTCINREIIKLISAIPEESFTQEFTMQFGSKPVTTKLWKLLLQWFNHHTHHRGQISNQLDLVGIDNNFSLMLDKIEE